MLIENHTHKLPKKIYFVRHAESIGNKLGLDDNSLENIPNHQFNLSEKGKKQAKELGEYLQESGILEDVKIFYSKFLRTKETMDIALSVNKNTSNIYKIQDFRLDEWWKGIFHSMTKEEIRKYYPLEPKIRDREGWYQYRPPQGESGKDVELRIYNFLVDNKSNYAVFRDDLEKNWLIFGHGRICSFMEKILTNQPDDFNCKYAVPKNCELKLFEKVSKRAGSKYESKTLFLPNPIDLN